MNFSLLSNPYCLFPNPYFPKKVTEPGLSAMFLTKVRFENQQKKKQLTKKIKQALFFGSFL